MMYWSKGSAYSSATAYLGIWKRLKMLLLTLRSMGDSRITLQKVNRNEIMES
jgi:hypothetical protein